MTHTSLSHNNPCFQFNIAITSVLILHTCEIRFNDVMGQSSLPMYSYAKIPKHGLSAWRNEYVLKLFFFFNSVRWIHLCDKKNLTFFDCCDKILLNSSWKTLLSLPKARLIKKNSRLV